MVKKKWVGNYFGSKKFGLKKSLGQKKCWSNIFGPKIFWLEFFLDRTFFWLKRNGSFGQKKFGLKKNCVKKIWGQKKFGSKKILGRKYFGPIKDSLWYPKGDLNKPNKIWVEIFLGSTIFWFGLVVAFWTNPSPWSILRHTCSMCSLGSN